MSVWVTETDFQLNDEYEQMRSASNGIGAVVQFVGLVRDFNHAGDPQASSNVATLELQHYPGMTEQVINEICTDATTRWDIVEPRVIHRVGKLTPGDQIVLVSVGSAHRANAFAACEFIMDQLKTKATFWKKELRSPENAPSQLQSEWLSMKESDKQRAERWSASDPTTPDATPSDNTE